MSLSPFGVLNFDEYPCLSPLGVAYYFRHYHCHFQSLEYSFFFLNTSLSTSAGLKFFDKYLAYEQQICEQQPTVRWPSTFTRVMGQTRNSKSIGLVVVP